MLERTRMATVVILIVLLLIIQVAFGAAGSWISTRHGRGALLGFLLGFFLSGIGLLIAALLPRSIEYQVRERLAVEQALGYYKETGRLPSASQTSIAGTSTVALPAAEWAPADTESFNNLLALDGDTISVENLLVAATTEDLPKPIRRLLRVPLETLPVHLGPKERVERVAEATSGTMRGLLAITNQRLFFLDQISGTLELEISRAGLSSRISASSLVVWAPDGAARFVHLSPTSRPALPNADMVAAKGHEALSVPRLRVCSDCEAEFTPLLVSDSCPDCGGDLYPVA
jgi:hypothetical protein